MTLTSKNPETLVLHAGPRSDASMKPWIVPSMICFRHFHRSMSFVMPRLSVTT